MTGFKHTFLDLNGVRHIVAMPRAPQPFTACGAWSHFGPENIDPLQPVTCIRCWWREIVEYHRVSADDLIEMFGQIGQHVQAGARRRW